jgi:ferric-dicitrate binding protein FerR (iron transport regulator)
MRENQQYQRYLQLAQKWVDGTISEAELKEYTDWLKRIDADAHIEIPAEIATSKAAHREKIFRALQHRIKGEGLQRHKPVYRSMLRWAAMFTGVILVGYMAYYLRDSTKEQPAQKAVTAIQDDVQPGTHGAILALGNGKVIVLDTAANGTLDNNVMKSREAVVFDRAPEGGPVQYNTLTTPRARQQQLVLPDGSRIWLNAESSIRFPAAFTGETREVEISGEVYFEINPDKTKPFIVKVQQSSVVVLGTHFNVMAYSDEAFLETTLLEGAVSFRSNNEQMILKPGQQNSCNLYLILI